MDYKQYIRENFPQGAFLPEERIDAFLSYAKDSTVQELERLAEAIQRQPWLAQWYHPRDDIQFQIDHMLRITGSQAITLTHEQGMWEKSRQMLLLEAPGTGSDDTVRGTLYEGWILAQADQMLRSAELAITALPNIMEKMGEPINGLSAAPDNLYWAKDHFVILDAKCPRTPHVSPPDAYVAQLHFYEAALRDLMKKNYPEWADAPIHKVLAQGNILNGRVTFLDIPTVPGMSNTLWNNAQVLFQHVIQNQALWPMPPQPVFDAQKMPEVESLTQQLLEIRDRKNDLDVQESALKERLQACLGNDPEQWPKLPKAIGGAMRPNWPRTADDKLLNALRENGISIPEKTVYDVDGMALALGERATPFIRDRIVDVSTAVKALEIAGVPRSEFQTPTITLLDKRPAKPKPALDAPLAECEPLAGCEPAPVQARARP
ncbi:hypothetical protein A6M27_04410 [Acidithiobacillus thiooxidans]|uniref:Uncharacterized protein n=1 Tax=Acidithiobacillus thiooxidans TaxID=930 RepID=A0A1C2IG44_ACITH|nr:hypothetical protein [Acidithiobacillus thiooxidans]MBU2843225.1 hypothetical protein [Acidithiobacillus thiooxidans]OCX73543.1 hypothetical protein A6P07_08355 [Acidithiobacillus thiooxidans]OCX74941.1 hypothetical protein A6M23_04185 [Acidithiobacillus thiooxidans]OCX78678.1 hypothetical protein A6O24_03945 [Acidithiobacillus thiooxidans]OCX82360.1 hypothetical protein A6O26_10135 [Acidithiobacillus thiooxidans]